MLYSAVAANPEVSMAFAVRYAGAFVDAEDFASTTLTFDERLFALLPDTALTSSEEEELSSLFEHQKRKRLVTTSIENKLIALFIIPPY